MFIIRALFKPWEQVHVVQNFIAGIKYVSVWFMYFIVNLMELSRHVPLNAKC